MTTSTDSILERVAALLESGDIARAEDKLETFHRDPNARTMESLLLLSIAHEARNKLAEASHAAEQAASLAKSDENAGRLYARAADLVYLQRPGKRLAQERIIDLLTRSVRHDPSEGNAESRRKLCATLLAAERYEELLAQSVELSHFPDDRSQARILAATACFNLNRKSRGESHLTAVLTDPAELEDQQLYRSLTLAIEYGALNEAERVLDWMKSANRAENYRREFLARIARERGDNTTALKILTAKYIDNIDHDASRQRHLALRGKCLDAVGDYAEAHRCFVEMNRIARKRWGRRPDPEQIGKLEQAIPRTPPSPQDAPRHPHEYTPTFLVGFPRSGTTLLESILDTSSHIQTLSERDAIPAIALKMKSMGLSYPEDLPHLDRMAIESLRKCYYDFQSQYVRNIADVKLIVDKLPLNILHIPMLHMLFPTAKFILALRNPADVCISCFQQDFQLNSEMVHFTDLEGCFRRYRDVFSLFERYRARLDLEMFTVRYEDLTEDLDCTTLGLFDFLGVEPEEHCRNFYIMNRDRLTNTPSRGQITKPMYRSSRNRWLNYAGYVHPLKSIIEDIVHRYGYSLKSPTAS